MCTYYSKSNNTVVSKEKVCSYSLILVYPIGRLVFRTITKTGDSKMFLKQLYN